MDDTSEGTAREALWNFALEIYAQPGVATACVLLQDRLGVDVTVLFHAMHAACRHRRVLDDPSLAAADALIGPWRSEVIEPLRAMRRRIKHGIARVPPQLADETRELVRRAELSAERAAMAVLGQSLGTTDAPMPPLTPDDLLSRICRSYALRSKRAAALGDPEVQEAMRVIQRVFSASMRAGQAQP